MDTIRDMNTFGCADSVKFGLVWFGLSTRARDRDRTRTRQVGLFEYEYEYCFTEYEYEKMPEQNNARKMPIGPTTIENPLAASPSFLAVMPRWRVG